MAGETQSQKKRHKLTMARLELGLTLNQLADITQVARATIRKVEQGIPIQDVKAYKIVRAINPLLSDDKKLTLDDIKITGEDNQDNDSK